jgi:hypothetical protein
MISDVCAQVLLYSSLSAGRYTHLGKLNRDLFRINHEHILEIKSAEMHKQANLKRIVVISHT